MGIKAFLTSIISLMMLITTAAEAARAEFFYNFTNNTDEIVTAKFTPIAHLRNPSGGVATIKARAPEQNIGKRQFMVAGGTSRSELNLYIGSKHVCTFNLTVVLEPCFGLGCQHPYVRNKTEMTKTELDPTMFSCHVDKLFFQNNFLVHSRIEINKK